MHHRVGAQQHRVPLPRGQVRDVAEDGRAGQAEAFAQGRDVRFGDGREPVGLHRVGYDGDLVFGHAPADELAAHGLRDGDDVVRCGHAAVLLGHALAGQRRVQDVRAHRRPGMLVQGADLVDPWHAEVL